MEKPLVKSVRRSVRRKVLTAPAQEDEEKQKLSEAYPGLFADKKDLHRVPSELSRMKRIIRTRTQLRRSSRSCLS